MNVFASLIGTLHVSPLENILTIALINIYYLYNRNMPYIQNVQEWKKTIGYSYTHNDARGIF